MFGTRSYEGVLDASHRNLLTTGDREVALDDVFGAMDKVHSHDEETQGSGSGSGLSDLSALENDTTDDFGRRLLQHQRDEQRLGALRGNQQAFRKARPKPRVAETLERQDRIRAEQDNGSPNRVGSSGSNESDPPVTVPKEWGRKARRQTDWMRKILEPSEPDQNAEETLKTDEDAIIPHRTAFTGDEDWAAGADDPLESVEQDTPPSMRRKRHSTTPSSMRHMNTTLKHVPDSEDGDFSAASLLASTPARTRLPRKIDELTRREIENIERQAVTTRALDQIDERSANGTVRKASNSKLRDRAIADSLLSSPPRLSRPTTAPTRPLSPSRIPRRPRSLVGNKENLQPNGEVNHNGSLKSSETVGLVNRTAQAVNIKNAERPRHLRNDSMNLLKKLARVSSMSPSPARDKAEAALRGTVKANDSAANVRPASAESAGSNDAAGLHPPAVGMEQGQWNFDTPGDDRLANGVDVEKHEEVELEQLVIETDRTPVPLDEIPEAKTPVVTGGWVDSPVRNDIAEHIEEFSAASRSANLRRTESEPANPKSALSAIIRENEQQKDDIHFGESTIQSLEDIVHPDLDPTDPTITFDIDALNEEAENLDPGQPLTQDQKDRRQEDLAMEALNQHLRKARTSIKDASRGLRRVENRIETAQEGPIPTSTTRTSAMTNKTVKHGNIDCEACGGGRQSVWYALWAELRSWFYSRDRSSRYGIRFTWLGMLSLFWLIWYISENTLCSIYCKPQYCSKPCDWSPDMPRYPFVIPTLIFRPIKPLWEPTCKALSGSLEAFFNDVLGDSSTTPHPPPVVGKGPVRKSCTTVLGNRQDWIATATTTSVRVAQSLVDVVDELSMWDDELLS